VWYVYVYAQCLRVHTMPTSICTNIYQIRVETGSGHPGHLSHFFAGHPGLTRFIKYVGLTQILLWIKCIINGVWK